MRGRTYSRNSQSSTATTGVRPEVTRDNMGHTTIDVTQNVYSKSWWEERPAAVSLAAASVWKKFQPTASLNEVSVRADVNPGV